MKMSRTFALVMAAGCAAPAFAQDSVSKFTTGLPGDANSEFTSGQTYIVDLTPFTTRANTQFGIAPILKASKTSTTFFTSLPSGNGISRTLKQGVNASGTNYSLWTTAGEGINTANNNVAGSSAAGPASSFQFGALLAEFDGPASNVLGAMVNVDPAAPGRLYVKRVVAATNRPDGSATGGSAALGVGAVDSDGNVVFRADNFGVTGANPISGNNIFRVDMATRNNAVANYISQLAPGDAAATVRIVNNSTTTHSVPNIIPENEGGPVYFGANFSSQIVRGSAAGVTTSDTSHYGSTGLTDHRGSMAYSPTVLLGTSGAVGTAAVLAKTATGDTHDIVLFDVNASGNPVGTPKRVSLPGTLTINDALDPRAAAFPIKRFDGYGSQTFSSGGVSQVAIGRDQAGRILIAATIYGTNEGPNPWGDQGNANPSNAIAVARLSSPTASPVWGLAAWNDCNALTGKPIRDENNVQIGRLGSLFEVTGGAPFGPSMSAPAIDSVGNIWFTGTGVFDDFAGPNPDNALFRAVYRPDTATPTYTIESVIDTGNVFAGQNSGRNWQLRFIEVADSNSISSAAMFSQGVVHEGFAGGDVSGLDPSDPLTNGGVIVAAGIIYDRDDDGEFDDPVVGGTPTGSVDEEYNVLLYIGALGADDGCALADYDGDTEVGILDFLAFLDDFGTCENQPTPCTATGFDADIYNPDGVIDILDFLNFFDLFGQCEGQ